MGIALRPSLFVVMAFVIALGDVSAQSFSGPTLGRAPRVHSHAQKPPPNPAGTAFGDPLPGLTRAEPTDFANGQDAFEEEDTPESGLGPIFNNVSSVACHSVPPPVVAAPSWRRDSAGQ